MPIVKWPISIIGKADTDYRPIIGAPLHNTIPVNQSINQYMSQVTQSIDQYQYRYSVGKGPSHFHDCMYTWYVYNTITYLHTKAHYG